jgi:hypothetical protein
MKNDCNNLCAILPICKWPRFSRQRRCVVLYWHLRFQVTAKWKQLSLATITHRFNINILPVIFHHGFIHLMHIYFLSFRFITRSSTDCRLAQADVQTSISDNLRHQVPDFDVSDYLQQIQQRDQLKDLLFSNKGGGSLYYRYHPILVEGL